MKANDLKSTFVVDVEKHEVLNEKGLCGATIGVLEKACGGEANRRLVLKYLTGKTSSKLLTPAEWYALNQFVKPHRPKGGHWQSERGEKLARECGIILAATYDQEGQAKMFAEVDTSDTPPKQIHANECPACAGSGEWKTDGGCRVRCEPCKGTGQRR